ncbi:MAG: hypothetical protein ACE5OQ_00645 [Woeseia sp.]
MIDKGRGVVTVNELLNFVICGAIAHLSLMRGVPAKRVRSPGN